MSNTFQMQNLSQTGRLAHQPPQSPPTGNPVRQGSQSINVVRKERRGYARAFPFELGDNETLAEFMGRLKTQLGAGKLRVLMKKVVTYQEEAIFEAPVLSMVACAHPDLELGVAFIDLGPLTCHDLLTEAYHNPKVLGDLVNVKDTFKRYELKPASSRNNIAMVLGWKTCKTYLFINLSILCAISLLIGVIVGLVCHDANLGVAIGGGLFALLSVIVTLLVVLTKE